MNKIIVGVLCIVLLVACVRPRPTPTISPISPVSTPQYATLLLPTILQNGDFEGPFTVRGNAQTVAKYWQPWLLSTPPCHPGRVGCDIPCPVNCNECPSRDQGCYWAQPEYAAAYQPDYKPPRVHTGDWAQKTFVYGREGRFGIYQQVQITTRSVLTFSAWFEAWQCFDSDHCSLQAVKNGGSLTDPPPDPVRTLFLMSQWGCGTDINGEGYRRCKLWTASDRPYAMHMNVAIDPNGGTNPMAPSVVWGNEVESYDYWSQAIVTTTTHAPGIVTVFTYASPTFDFARMNNDVYIDDAVLEIQPIEDPFRISLPVVIR